MPVYSWENTISQVEFLEWVLLWLLWFWPLPLAPFAPAVQVPPWLPAKTGRQDVRGREWVHDHLPLLAALHQHARQLPLSVCGRLWVQPQRHHHLQVHLRWGCESLQEPRLCCMFSSVLFLAIACSCSIVLCLLQMKSLTWSSPTATTWESSTWTAPTTLWSNRWETSTELLGCCGNIPVSNHVFVFQGLNNAVALDFHYAEQMIYWTDVTTQGSMIRRMRMNGSSMEVTLHWHWSWPIAAEMSSISNVKFLFIFVIAQDMAVIGNVSDLRFLINWTLFLKLF